MLKKIIYILLFLSSFQAYSQYDPRDCRDAIPVCGGIISIDSSVTGIGAVVNEIDRFSSCLIEGEKNSLWFMVRFLSSGEFGFEIIPNDPGDDYDWAVYDLTNASCAEIINNPSLEISCNSFDSDNIQNAGKGANGRTGPNGDSFETSQGKIGTPFNEIINASKGDVYLIIVSAWFDMGQDGYKIDFSPTTAKISDDRAPEYNGITPPDCGDDIVIAGFSENIFCESINANDFKIDGPGGQSIKSLTGINCAHGGVFSDKFELKVTPPFTLEGDYKVILKSRVSDVCNNEADIDDTVEFSISGPGINVVKGDTIIQKGESAYLEVEALSSGVFSYKWTPSTGLSADDIPNPKAAPGATTVYTVSIIDNIRGCESRETIVVTVKSSTGPTIIVEGDTIFCSGETVVLDAGLNPSNNQPFNSYQWYKDDTILGDSTNRKIEVGREGKYHVETINQNNEKGYDTVNITVLPSPEIEYIINNGAKICVGSSFIINTTLISSEGSVSYEWQNTDGFLSQADDPSPEILLNGSGNYQYILKATDEDNGCLTTLTIDVEVFETPELSLSVDKENCPYRIIAETGGSGIMKYAWEPMDSVYFPDPEDSSIVEVKNIEETQYSVTVEDENSCSSVSSINVEPLISECSLEMPEISGDPRSNDVRIPIKFISETDLLKCKPERCVLNLEWDMTMFNPREAYANGEEVSLVKNGEPETIKWEVTITIPGALISEPGENLVEIVGDIMLGRKESAPMEIVSAQWGNMNVNNTFENGSITLENLCKKNGTRLLGYSAPFEINNLSPNPAVNEVIVQTKAPKNGGMREVKLCDMVGRELYSKKWAGDFSADDTYEIKDIIINTSSLKSGIYRLIFIGGPAYDSRELILIK